MPDPFPPAKRSDIMSHVKGQDTKPEILVRRLLHRMGYRFRLQRSDLPGKPDIVLPKYRAVIFIHGCFWHGHPGCKRAARPTTNIEFWNKKLDRNMSRDARVQQELDDLGWRVLVVWQCEIKDLNKLEDRLHSFLLDIQDKRSTILNPTT